MDIMGRYAGYKSIKKNEDNSFKSTFSLEHQNLNQNNTIHKVFFILYESISLCLCFV